MMITAQNVSKVYVQGDTSVRAVNQVSLDIQPGEFVVIMGISGSEKYVLLHILGDLGEVNGYSDSLIGYDQSKDVI